MQEDKHASSQHPLHVNKQDMYTNIHTHRHTDTHRHKYTNIHTHTQTNTHTHAHTDTQTHISIQLMKSVPVPWGVEMMIMALHCIMQTCVDEQTGMNHRLNNAASPPPPSLLFSSSETSVSKCVCVCVCVMYGCVCVGDRKSTR